MKTKTPAWKRTCIAMYEPVETKTKHEPCLNDKGLLPL